MKKVTGIKSVDFKIKALGHGVVNWNGPTSLTGDGGKTVDNHTLPKLRGYTNLTGKVKEETGYKYRKEATDIDFKKTPLYISQNCIRHHLFRDQAFDVHYANKSKIDNLTSMLASVTGLVRGYVVPSSQNKRTSPLLIEDFVDQLISIIKCNTNNSGIYNLCNTESIVLKRLLLKLVCFRKPHCLLGQLRWRWG